MNRIWWDKRPTHLRDVAGWWDYHLPRVARALQPFRCRECHAWEWRHHKMSCATGRDLDTRQVIFWRTMVIIAGVLGSEVAFLAWVLAPMTPLTPLWWTLFTLSFVYSITAPFVLGRVLRNWWMPRR